MRKWFRRKEKINKYLLNSNAIYWGELKWETFGQLIFY